MAQKLTLNATKREAAGTGAAKRLRRVGLVPGVIYGSQQDNYAIQVKEKEFSELLHQSSGENPLINLCIEGAKEAEKLAMVQAVQHEPLSGSVIHIDFHAVKEDEELTAQVTVELVGEPEGVSLGGLLEQQQHTLEVRCLPSALPDGLEVDVTALNIGDALHAGDVSLPEGVTLHVDADSVVANVQEVKVIEEEPVLEELAEGEEAAEGEGEGEGEAAAGESKEGES